MTENAITEASTWFRERGFELVVTQEGAEWWASLKPRRKSKSDFSHYGRGDTPESAALRARERAEQEGKAADERFRRRARRIGFVFIASSPLFGIYFGLLGTVTAGLVSAAFCLVVGIYFAFAVVPFAAWIRRQEKSRGR